MKQVNTLIYARWIIPVEPDATVYEHYALAVDDGCIVDILPAAEAAITFEAFEEHHLSQHALLPGLINMHTHAAMNLFRGMVDDLPLTDWLENHIWPAEQQWVNEDFVRCGSQLAIAEMLRTGTTCFNDMYLFPEATAKIAKMVGIRAVIGLPVIDLPTIWASDANEYLRKGIAFHDTVKGEPLISTAFAPHAPHTVCDALLRKIGMFAEELDILIHMHLHETEDEVLDGVARYGVNPLQHLHQLNLLSPRLVAVHMTHTSKLDRELLANYGVNVVHCPASNLKLASGFCSAQLLINAGINVTIGTDSAASNNSLDMFCEMRMVALLAKAVAKDSTAVSAYTALKMATIHAARGLGLSEQIGSLVPGKYADIVAVDLGGVDSQPIYDPISQIVYTTNGQMVSDVWVQGVQQVEHKDYVGMDFGVLLEEAQSWRDKIASYAKLA